MTDQRFFNAQLAIACSAIDLQSELLPFHPHLQLGHVPTTPIAYPGAANLLHGTENAEILPPFPREELLRRIGDNREIILRHTKDATHEIISQLSELLQLSGEHNRIPPKIICSDMVDNKDAWSAGMDDGYYGIHSSFFMFRQTIPERIDYRVADTLGPVIHFNTEDLRSNGLHVITEEALHYLQWFYSSSPETHQSIIRWRALNEPDPELRKQALTLFVSENMEFTFPVIEREGSSLLIAAPKDSPRWWRMDNYTINGAPQRTFEDSMANSIICEACAEFFRIRSGASVSDSSYSFIEEWQKAGIEGWTKAFSRGRPRKGEKEDSQQFSAMTLYTMFFDQDWNQFIDALKSRNKVKNLDLVKEASSTASQSSISPFPSDIVHFLGYGLGQELDRCPGTQGKVGLQEMSLRMFSYLVSPVERLESLKQLLRNG